MSNIFTYLTVNEEQIYGSGLVVRPHRITPTVLYGFTGTVHSSSLEGERAELVGLPLTSGSQGWSLDVNLKEATLTASLEVNLDHNNDDVLIYGNDGTTDRKIKTNTSGYLDVVSNDKFLATEDTLVLISSSLASMSLTDFATETTLKLVSSSLGSIDSKDFATETTLQLVSSSLGNIDSKDFATETTLQLVSSSLGNIDSKDFATETTLQLVSSSLEVIDDWDATEGSPIGNDGSVIMLEAKSSQKAELADGDAVRPVANLRGEQVIAGHSWSTNSNRSEEISPINLAVLEENFIDTTNVAAGTNYYPSSLGRAMLGYKDFSITGSFIDADGTITWSVEATNDEDPVTADWIQIYGYDAKNNTTVNSMTFTNSSMTFAWDFDNLNYRFVRVKVVNDGATNTFILKSRMKAL